MNKTNAMRMLDKEKIEYEVKEYKVDGALDAITVSKLLNEPVENVFKTLVTQGDSKEYYVFCIPGKEELDLKKCARVVNEKAIAMIPQKNLLPLTGYIHGGCCPIGMKKKFKTIIHESIILLDKVYVSAGKIGMQLELKPDDLIKASEAIIADLIR